MMSYMILDDKYELVPNFRIFYDENEAAIEELISGIFMDFKNRSTELSEKIADLHARTHLKKILERGSETSLHDMIYVYRHYIDKPSSSAADWGLAKEWFFLKDIIKTLITLPFQMYPLQNDQDTRTHPLDLYDDETGTWKMSRTRGKRWHFISNDEEEEEEEYLDNRAFRIFDGSQILLKVASGSVNIDELEPASFRKLFNAGFCLENEDYKCLYEGETIKDVFKVKPLQESFHSYEYDMLISAAEKVESSLRHLEDEIPIPIPKE